MNLVEMAGSFMLASMFIFVGGGLLVILGAGTWAVIDGLRSSEQKPEEE